MAKDQRAAELACRLKRHVVLVGLMGAGKSTIGRRVADRIGARFLDADREIEDAAGMSIPDIFASHGEGAFRDGERRVIARILEETPLVLATGGGAFMDPETRATIREHATSVWLRANLEVLVQRCGKRQNRPLLAGGDPRETLARLKAVRDPVYAEADVIVDTRDEPHEAAVGAILRALRKRGDLTEES